MAKDEIVKGNQDSEKSLSVIGDAGVLSGVDLASAMAGKSDAEKLTALRLLTSYVGATTEKIDAYLGQRLTLIGLVIQRATIKLDTPTVDPEGNVIEYGEADRVVMKINSPDGKEHMISFVSMAVASFAKSFLVPLFGMGDYKTPIPVVVRQTSNQRGRTYNLQVVE